jgi:hypothetical protein
MIRFGLMQDITLELPVFLREHFNGMYRTDVYFLCKTTADIPVYIFFPFLFVAIPYYAIGLNPDVGRFFIACGIVILLANVATSFGKKNTFVVKISDATSFHLVI